MLYAFFFEIDGGKSPPLVAFTRKKPRGACSYNGWRNYRGIQGKEMTKKIQEKKTRNKGKTLTEGEVSESMLFLGKDNNHSFALPLKDKGKSFSFMMSLSTSLYFCI